MKRTSVPAVIACGLALAGAEVRSAPNAEPPKRKPGLWEITSLSAAAGMTTFRVCIGASDSIATPADSGDCSEPVATPAGKETIVNVVCKKPHGKQTVSTVFSGDFTTWYHGVVRITFDPPEGEATMGVTIDGKYVGPDCPPDASAAPSE